MDFRLARKNNLLRVSQNKTKTAFGGGGVGVAVSNLTLSAGRTLYKKIHSSSSSHCSGIDIKIELMLWGTNDHLPSLAPSLTARR